VKNLVLVAAGGALGAVTRHGLNAVVMRFAGTGFPLGILVVNVLGCFAMGVLASVLFPKAGPATVPSLFLMTGVLGGFTTFSAFAFDTLKLVQQGQAGVAAAYVLASVGLSLLAVFAGFGLLRMVYA
jgi:fluoride exporter